MAIKEVHIKAEKKVPSECKRYGSVEKICGNSFGIPTAHKSLDVPRQRRPATRPDSNVPRSRRFATAAGPQAPMYQLNLITSGRVIDANVENLTILK